MNGWLWLAPIPPGCRAAMLDEGNTEMGTERPLGW